MNPIRKRTDQFTETAVDDEIVVMRLDSGEFYSLSGTAASAWRLIDGSRDRNAIVAELASEFAGDEADIGADVDDLLRQLRNLGLLASE